MSSSIAGVQARMHSVSPMAFYTHCQNHQLNLCVVKACLIPQIRNASGIISEIAKFCNYSPKCQHFFEHIIDAESPNETKKKVKDLCRTRWVQWIDSYAVFYYLYASIIKTMEAISTCSSEYGAWSWDTETLTKARGFLHQLVSFEFLVTFNATMRVLSSVHSLTVKLQKTERKASVTFLLHTSMCLKSLLIWNCLRPTVKKSFTCGTVKKDLR